MIPNEAKVRSLIQIGKNMEFPGLQPAQQYVAASGYFS